MKLAHGGFALLTLAGLFAAATASTAATGVGELSLDRAAVAALLHEVLPGRLEIPVGSLGEVALTLTAPSVVQFVDGGVEADVGLRLDLLAWSGSVHVRYVVEFERLHGRASLRAVEAVPDLTFPVRIDLADHLPLVELPPRIDWRADLGRGEPTRLSLFVQEIGIDDERLTLRFGLLTGQR